MSKTINPYEEYLEATREAPLVTLGKHAARYSLSRFASTLFSYPWESMVLLRQVQYDNHPARTTSESPVEKTLEEQRAEYERYLLNPTGPAASRPTQLTGMVSSKDQEGYVNAPIISNRLQLDLKKSVLNSMYTSVQREGLYGLYQGCAAYNAKKIAADLLHDGLLPILFNGSASYGESILQEAAVSVVSAVLLNPLEVAHIKLTVQSPYRHEQTYENGLYSVLSRCKLRDLFGGVMYNILARTSEIVGTAVISRYGCALVDQLRVSSYYWLTTGYFLVNLVAMNVPLLLSVPCDTIRRRLAVSGIRSARVPIRGDWTVRQQLHGDRRQLYHGLAFRVATNTAFLLINLMTELEAEWLGHGGEDF